MGMAVANMQWGHFVCPPVAKEAEHAFDLVLRRTWGLSSPIKQVGRCSTQVLLLPTSQVCGRKSEWWPKYMEQKRQCWMWEEFDKQAQSSKGKNSFLHCLT